MRNLTVNLNIGQLSVFTSMYSHKKFELAKLFRSIFKGLSEVVAMSKVVQELHSSFYAFAMMS